MHAPRSDRASAGRACASSCRRSPPASATAAWQTLVVLIRYAGVGRGPALGGVSEDRHARARRAAPRRASRLPPADPRRAEGWLRRRARSLQVWSPGTSPTSPPFVSPAAREDATADSPPSLAPGVGAPSSRGRCRQTLIEAPGDQQLVIGETAGLLKDTARHERRRSSSAGLPQDVVCASPTVPQHAYIGGDDPVERWPSAALAAHDCPEPHTTWITRPASARRPGVLAPIANPRWPRAAYHADAARAVV